MTIAEHAARVADPSQGIFSSGRSPLAANALVHTLFERRGWTQEFLADFDDPTFAPLRDMDAMVAALKEVHDSGELIVVMPDYDMDGISAGTLLWAGLSELGFNTGLYTPDYNDGHDILPRAVDKLKTAFPAAATVITCDAGINSHDGIARGKALGMRMLVTDHHHQEEGPVVPADVAVNPCRLDDDYRNKKVCGAFVAWQVLDAYARAHEPRKERSIDLLRLFAGVGTVSDVMDLRWENRALVRDSVAIARSLHVPIPAADTVTEYDPEDALLMQVLRAEGHHEAYLSAFLGFAVLLRAFREHGKMVQDTDESGSPLFDDQGDPVMVRARGPLREVDDIDAGFYGFYLAPTFNAVRRTGAPMAHAFGVFTAPTAQEKLDHAIALIENNHHRQEVAAQHLEDLDREEAQGLQPLAPWVWETGAAPGMHGLLANEMMQRHGHPVAVVSRVARARDPRGGSMRAPEWFDIITTLSAHGLSAQGHQQACGVRLADAGQVQRLAQVLEQEVGSILAQAQAEGRELVEAKPDLVLGNSPDADAPLRNHDDLVELALAIQAMEPYGQGFEPPRIEIALDLSRCRKIGTTGKQDRSPHLRIITSSGLKIYWWNRAETHLHDLRMRAYDADGAAQVRMRVRLGVNEYMGHVFPQFTIEEIVEQGEAG